MRKLLVAAAVAALLPMASGIWAAEDDVELEKLRAPKPAQSVRQESLELPGLTACHQCEWRPKLNNMAAAVQCGTMPDGIARSGRFECGFSPECERVCNFIECIE